MFLMFGVHHFDSDELVGRGPLALLTSCRDARGAGARDVAAAPGLAAAVNVTKVAAPTGSTLGARGSRYASRVRIIELI
jgi:hypothetical protein